MPPGTRELQSSAGTIKENVLKSLKGNGPTSSNMKVWNISAQKQAI